MEFFELILTPKLDNVTLHNSINSSNSINNNKQNESNTLCITGHHIILSTRKEGTQELWLLHQNVDAVERKPIVVNNIIQGGSIILKCKDLRIIQLDIQTAQEFINVANSIEQLSRLEDQCLQYPFFYRPMYSILEDGYQIYRPEIEFSKILATDDWRLSSINRDYSICSTYPSSVVVPKSITDEQLMQSASFRDGGRFPVLSYRHDNGTIMMRSSQPLSTGPNVKRCRADEAILNVVLEINARSKKGFIVDTWGKNNKSNSETDQHYSQWRKIVRPLGITNISGILDSFTKLVDACNDTQCSTDKWLSRLDNSNWLSLLVNALDASCVVAQCLDQDSCPVLVHGGKGLDSTIIITSIVQIILNPDCRTVTGLQALIEREWLQSGHPFASRHKHSCYSPNRTKSSGATFVLFLDCVYQLFSQFPCSFEYDTHLLITLFEHSYFSPYGTFLCDSERERVQLKVFTRTTSLWSHLNRPDILTSYLNPLYEPNKNVLWPSVAPISITLFSELYLRWVVDQNNVKNMNNQIQALVSREKELRSKVIKLRKQLFDLHKDYQQQNLETVDDDDDDDGDAEATGVSE